MASRPERAKRRLQIVVKESACPGLIANLAQLPKGCENVFIRAVLVEWFASNNNDTELANRLVEQYRTIEFRNEVGIRTGEQGWICLRDPTTALQADRGVGQTVSLQTTPFSNETGNHLSPVRVPPPESSAPTAASLVHGELPVAAPAPAFDVEFDPDQF